MSVLKTAIAMPGTNQQTCNKRPPQGKCGARRAVIVKSGRKSKFSCFQRFLAWFQKLCYIFGVIAWQIFEPSAGDARGWLRGLQRRHGRAGSAALLGVSPRILDNWRTGARDPSAPSKRALWFLWALTFRPGLLSDPFEVVTWGRYAPQVDETPPDYEI